MVNNELGSQVVVRRNLYYNSDSALKTSVRKSIRAQEVASSQEGEYRREGGSYRV